MSFDIPPSQRDQTLPMILMLRGDEAIADDFTLDSDQAMEFLGIKRSRLSQISGRELRVARIRKDRYVRPVYRECDLRDYMDWTRATATHLSSSKAIEQAVENLDDRFNDVVTVLNERLGVFNKEQQNFFRAELERLPSRLQGGSSREAEEEAAHPLHREDVLLRKQIEAIAALGKLMGKAQSDIGELSTQLEMHLPAIREISLAQRTMRLEWQESLKALLEAIDVLQNNFNAQLAVQSERLEQIQSETFEKAALAVMQSQIEIEGPTREGVRMRTARSRRTQKRSYWMR